MKSRTGVVEERCPLIRLPAAISTTQEPSLTKREGRHSMYEVELSDEHVGSTYTHVDLLDSFQSHQVFSSFPGFPFFTGRLGLRHRSRCFSDLRIQ